MTWVLGLWIAYGVAATLLIGLVLRARPITAGNGALVALLVQQAAVTFTAVFASAVRASDAALSVQATIANIPATMLWSPLVFLAGPLLLGNGPHAKQARIVGVAGAVPTLLFLLAWPFVPNLVIKEDLSGLTDLATAMLFLVFTGFAFTVFVLAREALTTPLPVRRGQFALLAAAFSVEGVYHVAQNAAKIGFGQEFHGLNEVPLYLVGMSAVPLLAFVAIAGWAGMVALRKEAEPDHRRWGRILLGFIGAAAVTGALASTVTVANEYEAAEGSFHALWDLAAVALIVYAGLRFQLFNLEKRAKQSVAVAAAAALGFVVFNSVQELTEQVLGGTVVFDVIEGVAGDSASGVVAALFVGVVSIPIGKAGQGVARKLFPHVVPTEDYEHHRKMEIYRASLEGAFADGVETPKEVASLTRLRQALGITDEEHERMELEVRIRLGKPLPSRITVGVDEAPEATATPPPAPSAPLPGEALAGVAPGAPGIVLGDALPPAPAAAAPALPPPPPVAPAPAPPPAPPPPPPSSPPSSPMPRPAAAPPPAAPPPMPPAAGFQVMRKPAAAPARPTPPATRPAAQPAARPATRPPPAPPATKAPAAAKPAPTRIISTRPPGAPPPAAKPPDDPRKKQKGPGS